MEPVPLPDATGVMSCRDCAATFAAPANFCPQCGQETRVTLPRVLDFLREAADETIGISGRLPRTLRLLMLQPGRLTNEYIAGHRQRYVRPMRLYLSVSLLFFGLLGLATSDLGWIHLYQLDVNLGRDAAQETKPAEPAKEPADKSTAPSAADPAADPKQKLPEVDLSGLDRTAPRSKAASKGSADPPQTVGGIADEVRSDFARDLARDRAKADQTGEASKTMETGDDDHLTGLPWLEERLKPYRSMSKKQFFRTLTQGAQANAPYAVFILMPLAAFWYQLFYVFRGRRYAEHLLHAVHLHCFAFCIGTIALLPWPAGWRTWMVLAVGLYAWLAERRVYRSGWIRAGIGTVIGSFLYFIGISIVGSLLAVLALLL